MNAYSLPTSLCVSGVFWNIRTDWRVILGIFRYLTSEDYTDYEKLIITLKCLYVDYEKMQESDYNEAYKQANLFFSCADEEEERAKRKTPKIMDWEQDAKLIMPAINAVAGCEIRALPYLHWWTFLGYYQEIGDCTFSQVLAIRRKNAKGEKLEKWEKDYCKDYPDLVYLKTKLSEEEKRKREEDRQALEELLGGKK